MSPQGKASIIRSIQEVNKDFHVFMCGDGGTDVGALKQVHANAMCIFGVNLFLFNLVVLVLRCDGATLWLL